MMNEGREWQQLTQKVKLVMCFRVILLLVYDSCNIDPGGNKIKCEGIFFVIMVLYTIIIS